MTENGRYVVYAPDQDVLMPQRHSLVDDMAHKGGAGTMVGLELDKPLAEGVKIDGG